LFATIGLQVMPVIKLAVYWGSWAYFPLAVLCVRAILRANPAVRALASLALALSSVAA
jgi:Na+-transporting NADH:ubiquinone oxidoreductase subunit NqrB